MDRKKLTFLLDWLGNEERRKPLIIRGARQVGKTTLVRMLAESSRRRLVLINLERHVELDAIFATLNLPKIIAALESLPGAGVIDDNCLLFFDEIQATPHALAALRYFYEERPHLPLVAAGSLLEFVLADHSFSMPVGRVRFMNLDPMSFEEFLLALKEDILLQRLQTFGLNEGIDRIAHQRLTELFKTYTYVGGMPEAVAVWIASGSPLRVREVHDSLTDTYKADFAKYGLKRDLQDLHILFDKATRSVGQKVKYSALLQDEQSRTVRRLLDLLVGARLFYKIFHSDCQGLPLRAGIDDKVFKLLMLDVGLFNAVRRFEWSGLDQELTTAVAHRGALAEQLVGQELTASDGARADGELVYWLRDKRGNNAEIDYVMAYEGQIIPIEVKSGESGTLKSLFVFAEAHGSRQVVRFDLNVPSSQTVTHTIKGAKTSVVKVNLISLPLYATSQLARILRNAPPL